LRNIQSISDNHRQAATADSHPDRRCLLIQIAALQTLVGHEVAAF
jgi:hypothetical protein